MQDEVKVSQAARDSRVARYLSDQKEARENLATYPENIRQRLEAWQTEQREWFSDTILEIVAEFITIDDAIRHQTERDTLGRMEWRDIKSAPKDGTPILTCRMGESVSWFNYTTVGGYAEPPEAAYWVEVTECWQPFQRPHDEWRPTHWMPLPPAPEAGQ